MMKFFKISTSKNKNIALLLFFSLSLLIVTTTAFSAEYAGLGSDGAAIQGQVAELEAARLNQIKNALLQDVWAKYRVYIQALAAGTPASNIAYPSWALSSNPSDAKANFKYLLDNFLPDLKDQIAAMSKLTGTAEDSFYEVQYIPPTAGEPLPALGRVAVRRLNADVPTQGRLRGLLPSVTIANIGASGVVSLQIEPPTAYVGSEALNVALVRNNGLTLDPLLAAEAASSLTGGPDTTFIPGTWVTFAKKGENIGTAAAKGDASNTVYAPTIRFKGSDGNMIGVNLAEMTQVADDPVARILFRAAATPSGPATGNYIRFENNLGRLIGVNNIYRRDGADGVSGNNLELAIWAQLATGGDITVLSNGDTVNGETNTRDNVIRFGLNNRARIFYNATGQLRIESDNGSASLNLKSPTIIVEGALDVQGNTVLRNGLNMSGTNITNVGNLSANSATIGSTSISGNTMTASRFAGKADTAGHADTATNATYAQNAGLLGGKAEGSLNVNYATSAGSANTVPASGIIGSVNYANTAGYAPTNYHTHSEYALVGHTHAPTGGGGADTCLSSFTSAGETIYCSLARGHSSSHVGGKGGTVAWSW